VPKTFGLSSQRSFKNMKCYTKSVADHSHCHGYLKVVDTSTGMPGKKNFVVYKQLCHSSAGYSTFMENKLCVLPIKLQKHDDLHEK
jgi:hypothetical protein